MPYNILIVDDSSITRMVLKKTISMSGIPTESILEADNGREGLEILKQHKVDLILADLNMPEMNGLEMTQQIFAEESFCHIPVVVVSTEASKTRIDMLQSQGIQSFIHKPFTPEVIRKVLLSVLEPAQSRD
ncbi:MAG: response regulator [Sedimentisphaerales bacterium]|nr:response regulator [Sedimentisphaerales bacterium]